MIDFTYLALSNDQRVIAAFKNSEDADKFCEEKNLCKIPFNNDNGTATPCPAVGTKYIA